MIIVQLNFDMYEFEDKLQKRGLSSLATAKAYHMSVYIGHKNDRNPTNK